MKNIISATLQLLRNISFLEQGNKFTALKQDNAKIRESDPDPETMKPYEEQIPIFVH